MFFRGVFHLIPLLPLIKKISDGRTSQKIAAKHVSGEISLGTKFGYIGLNIKLNLISGFNSIVDRVRLLTEITVGKL